MSAASGFGESIHMDQQHATFGERVRALEEWRKYVGQRMAEMHADAERTREILASIERTLARIQWLVLGMLLMATAGDRGIIKYLLSLL
jgi:hypothetical protein